MISAREGLTMRPFIQLVAMLFISALVQAQVYKWTDADGQVHYGNQPPAESQSTETLDIQSQPTPAGGVDNVRSMQRGAKELRELRSVNRGVPVGELDRPTARDRKRKSQEPVYIGYEDRIRIETLNSDIQRLSSSTFGTASSRNREIRAAKSELRQIYRKYGMKGP
jgi:Domain of unknown function (DUF4124)